MKFDREWLGRVHDFERAYRYLETLIPQMPLRDRFHITKAYTAVAYSFRAHMDGGCDISHDWEEIAQLVSLSEDLVEEETARCAAYSSQAQGN